MDLQTLITRRDAYAAAELAILGGQEYTIDVDGSSRSLKRADLKVVQDAIHGLDVQIQREQNKLSRSPRVRYLRLR